MCPFSTRKELLGSAKICGINFQKKKHSFSIDQKLFLQKTELPVKKTKPNGRKTAKNGYLFAPVSQKHSSKSKVTH